MLNSHLQYTSSEYDQKKDPRGVHPISVTDAEIIQQLIDVTTQLGLAPLLEVLEQWKNLGDSKILDALIQMNEALENGEELMPKKDDKKKTIPTEYITIQDEDIRVKDIFRIKRTDGYVDDFNCYMWSIHINPIGDADKITGSLVTDAFFHYRTEELRNQAIEELKEKLVSNKKCKFL